MKKNAQYALLGDKKVVSNATGQGNVFPEYKGKGFKPAQFDGFTKSGMRNKWCRFAAKYWVYHKLKKVSPAYLKR